MYDFSTDYETFYTGATNPGISGLYATYRGKTNLPQWDGEHCSNIELASDGTKFKSFIQPNETIKFFRKSMCRPINLVSQCKCEIFVEKKFIFYFFIFFFSIALVNQKRMAASPVTNTSSKRMHSTMVSTMRRTSVSAERVSCEYTSMYVCINTYVI